MLVLKVDGSFSDAALPTLRRDPLLYGAGDGVRFLFDAAFPFSYAGGVPTNGVAIKDVAERSNGSFVLAAGETVGFNGNGFDFALMTAVSGQSPSHVLAPASVWADIAAQQYFLLCMYMRLPAQADWNAEASILPFFASSNNSNGYNAVADPITVAFSTGSKSIGFRRQTAVGAQVDTGVIPAAGHYGQVVQVAYWRNAAGVGARIKGSAGAILTTGAVGAANAADITACQPRFGSVQPFTNYAMATHRTCRKYRMYRGFIENLARSGRDPVAVLDADYERTAARGVFA
ncbi:MAG: hypothetical protein ACK4FZ_15150 [Vogesella sp.]|uniref:hypothetical protein n=1 Tax=Vogesella sp. TaxID=1904252 RepID=UPI00391C1CF8